MKFKPSPALLLCIGIGGILVQSIYDREGWEIWENTNLSAFPWQVPAYTILRLLFFALALTGLYLLLTRRHRAP